MLVQVQWNNKTYDYVQDFMLDDLIAGGGVARFLRSSGWATIGVDPIRARNSGAGYHGEERRTGWQTLTGNPETSFGGRPANLSSY